MQSQKLEYTPIQEYQLEEEFRDIDQFLRQDKNRELQRIQKQINQIKEQIQDRQQIHREQIQEINDHIRGLKQELNREQGKPLLSNKPINN